MADSISITREKKKKKAADNGSAFDSGAKLHPLEAPEVQDRARQLMEYRRQARLNQAEPRMEMAKDQDYFDGIQWSDEDLLVMEQRGQAPLVFNLVAITLRWVTGTEKRTRIDYRVMGRREKDLKPAEAKTSLLKYLSDVNRQGFARSRAFADAAIVGLGWLEDGIKNDPEDEPLYARYESWRNMWYDPLSIEPDMSDARFLFREKWVDLDVAKLMFPERAHLLDACADNILTVSQTNQEFGANYNPYLYGDPGAYGTVYGEPGDVLGMGTRKRLLLCEAWYRVPQKIKIMKGEGTFNGAVYDESDKVHAWAIQNQLATTHDAVRMVMHLMILCVNKNGMLVLQDGRSPYWHNRFPFTPVWGYRRGRDNAPYGIVRSLRDAQDDLNKRRAKALQLLSTKQVIAEKGAVDDKNEAQEEVARPDGWVEVNGQKRFDIRDNTTLAPAQVNMMDQSARYIQEAAGVTDENLGRQTNAVSGKAIEARQNQGYTATSDLFDNLRLAIQLTGERQLSLIEQFYDDEKCIRLTGERKSDIQFVQLNAPDGLNPITESQADFIVDEQDFRGTIRQAMFDTIMEMVVKLPPQVGLKLLTLAFEMSDVPMRDEFVKVLRDITGMKDPNAEEDPAKVQEQQQAQAAQMQAQAQAQALQRKQIELTMKKMETDIALIEAKAKEAAARGNKVELEGLVKKLEALKQSMDLAGSTAVAPELAAAADQIMSDAAKITTNAEPINVPDVNNIAPGLPPGVQ